MNFIDLFAGAGGLSIGFEKAGFNNKGFIEFWQPAIETQLNHKTKLITKDIRKFNEQDNQKLKEIDVIVGGPPCQGFSMAGKRKIGDKRNTLFQEYLRVVDLIQPKFCLLENVKGIYSMKDTDGKYIFNKIIKQFKKRGYDMTVKLMNSANYGVPQKRERIIFIANNQGIDYEFPQPQPKKYLEQVFNLPYQEIKSIQHIYPQNLKVMKKTSHLKQGKKLSSFGSAGIKLKNTFAPTITKTGRYTHPNYNRIISVREAARIQTFPDQYNFSGTIDEKYGQIGNAVPCEMAYHLARSIKTQIH